MKSREHPGGHYNTDFCFVDCVLLKETPILCAYSWKINRAKALTIGLFTVFQRPELHFILMHKIGTFMFMSVKALVIKWIFSFSSS